MALAHERVSVGTTATLLSSQYAGKDGQTVSVQNPSTTVTVYIGGAGVTTTSYGYALETSSDMSYGVVASSTLTVNILRQGV